MKKVYETPDLYVDEYAADTMIASSETGELTEWQLMGGIGIAPKNGNAANNHNCWGCNHVAGAPDPNDPENACADNDGSAYNNYFCP